MKLTLALLLLAAGCASSVMSRGALSEGVVSYEPEFAAAHTEEYTRIDENPFLSARENPLSTFSIDVDTASYANVRRFLDSGALPPHDAVRIEELINYFPCEYAPPSGNEPFAVHLDVATCPWRTQHRLVRIGLKGREIDWMRRPSTNLVFLIDTSGSMAAENKLGLLKRAFRLLAENLTENDRVAIVAYAGSAGLVLPSTTGDRKEAILRALDRLHAGGSTNGGEGIELAYRVAERNHVGGGVNRIVLATDGDFNVGVTSSGALTRLIEKKARGGTFLTVLGFGAGNLKDSRMEQLADRGNGNYAYVDNFNEARKVFVEQATGTLITIAKDVKVQVEFNPARVHAYRLIGYENRLLRAEDFNDDRKDAGDIGAGHTVTALYEVVPFGVGLELPQVDRLKYGGGDPAPRSDDLLTVKLRYKEPDGSASRRLVFPLVDRGVRPDGEFRFVAAVAAWGMLLRESKHRGDASFELVRELARPEARDAYRKEFLELVEKSRRLGR